jgi:hypothetical protein
VDRRRQALGPSGPAIVVLAAWNGAVSRRDCNTLAVEADARTSVLAVPIAVPC